jgi:ABC-type phosphate transport system substrate-binding protein
VLDGATQGSNVTVEGSDGLVKTAVANDANGIGYIGLAYQGAGIKALDVNGVACNTAEIKTKTYPLWRYIWLVLPSTGANPTVVAFENWITTSVAAGEIISSVGGVPEFNPAPPPTKAQQLATAEAKCKKEAKSKQAACIKAAKKKY